MEIDTEIPTNWMVFRLVEKKAKTDVWNVTNKSSGFLLAVVKWYGPFRQYCFFPADLDAVFNDGCLKDITGFLEKINLERREGRFGENHRLTANAV